MLARFVVAGVAVIVLAWVGVLARDHELYVRAATSLFYHPHVSSERLHRDMRQLEDAELMNPDSAPQLARARLYALHGLPGPALREATSLADREPENFDAWAVLYATATPGTRPSRRAAAALRDLDPLIKLRR